MPEEVVSMDHLKGVVKKIVAENPEKAVHTFELMGKSTKSFFDHTLTEEEVNARISHANAYPKFACDPVDEDGNAVPLCSIPDFPEECLTMFDWVGTGFGAAKSYAIMNAVKHFAAKTEGLNKVRFWGMINGTDADYYIAEGQLSAPGEADPEDPTYEPLGTGANAFAYWVTNDVFNPTWTKLSDTFPKHITGSRDVRKIFSGNLNAPVVSYPWFAGLERDLLRATIARIASDTTLNIKGFLATDEEGNIAEAEEFTYPELAATEDPAAWVHCSHYILQNGRCTYLEIDPDDEAQAAEYEALQEMKTTDPEQPLLRDLVPEDWTFKKYGRVMVARSVKWPGAITCYKEKTFSNVYVGYGHERGAGLFFPIAPPPVLTEPADVEEQPEPWPVEGPPADEESDGGEVDA